MRLARAYLYQLVRVHVKSLVLRETRCIRTDDEGRRHVESQAGDFRIIIIRRFICGLKLFFFQYLILFLKNIPRAEVCIK